MRSWTVVLAAVVATACAHGWWKPGASAADLKADQAACREEGDSNLNVAADSTVEVRRDSMGCGAILRGKLTLGVRKRQGRNARHSRGSVPPGRA